ncbi:hypothetical protein K458DRAFT_395334 [Lentithecium fluviatile CBS 122367]|uniref:Nephrocystin 3-like N-terminal domain-containing protein n=1 Tax=Lentithecium fluviatile CBS 122367 TaxID=1168545 RepID=A0A6G1IIH6_9PLEO|nr:hypothetical protein K458DRAFT_395334 [Lentithecium fluviatile CBS 122367]
MAGPLSIASGIAGIITLSSAVVAARYKYINSVLAAPEDFKELARDIAFMNTILSQLVSLSLLPTSSSRHAFSALTDQKVLPECERILLRVQALIHKCELARGSRRKKTLIAHSWPMKQDDISKSRERFHSVREVVDWLDRGNLPWLDGSSGTGKTVLVSSIIDHIRESRLRDGSSTALAYHYCDFAHPLTLDTIGIAGSLVRQLAKQVDTFLPGIRVAYHKSSANSPSPDDFIMLLEQITSKKFETAYIVIDGIDDILLSSRPEYDIQQALKDELYSSIPPQHVEASLNTHIRKELMKIPRLLHLSASTQDDLATDLVFRADGMFRWLQCQLDVLRKAKTLRALRDALSTIPEGLYETYDRVLHCIDESDYEDVELAEAIALDPIKDRLDVFERLIDPKDIFGLVGRCGSLIRIDEDGSVMFAHFSVKEYLLSNRFATQESRISRFTLQEDSSRGYVSMCLLSYHYWMKHDTRISQGLRTLAPLLEWTRKRDVDYCDTRVLYSTLLSILKSMEGQSNLHGHLGRCMLSRCLNLCGPEYYEYASVLDEQSLASTGPVVHPHHCCNCVRALGAFFLKQSNGEMDLCKGHTFYVEPRDCWYGFKEGTVTEDGKTFAEVISLLQTRFTELLAQEAGS